MDAREAEPFGAAAGPAPALVPVEDGAAAEGTHATADEAPASDQPEGAKTNAHVVRWAAIGVGGAAVVALLALGVPRLVAKLTLPDCNDADAQRIVGETLEDKKIKPHPFSKVRAVSATRTERVCAARMEYSGGQIDLLYRIDWNGWTPQVKITEMAAQAVIEPEHLDEVRKAADEFVSLASASPVNGHPPRQSEPTVRRLLDTVFDLAKVEGAALAPSEVAKALDWSRAGDRIGTVYILAGTSVGDVTRLANNPTAQQRTHRNVADFAPEFARYLDFEVKLGAIMMEAELKRAADASDEERVEAKRITDDVRATLAQTLAGDLTTLAYEGVSDEWRRQRLATMMQVAPKAAKFLNPEQARALRQHAMTVVSYVKEKSLQDGIKAFGDAVAPPQ